MAQEILAAHGLYSTHNLTVACFWHMPGHGMALNTAQPAQLALLQELMRAHLHELFHT